LDLDVIFALMHKRNLVDKPVAPPPNENPGFAIGCIHRGPFAVGL